MDTGVSFVRTALSHSPVYITPMTVSKMPERQVKPKKTTAGGEHLMREGHSTCICEKIAENEANR
jgi:hypothetical protein